MTNRHGRAWTVNAVNAQANTHRCHVKRCVIAFGTKRSCQTRPRLYREHWGIKRRATRSPAPLAAGQQGNRGEETRASQAEGSDVVLTGWPSRLALVDGLAARPRPVGRSEAYACVVGRRTRPRGSLSSAEVQTGPMDDAGRQSNARQSGAAPGPYEVTRRRPTTTEAHGIRPGQNRGLLQPRW